MANPCDYLAEIAEDFEILTSRQDQLLTLRQYGDYLDAMDAHLKTDSALVPGCASATHIVGELQADLFCQKRVLNVVQMTLIGLRG